MATRRHGTNQESARWLVLIHQLPSEPAYLRVKVGRRLAKLGAVALKNSVYLLPSTDACREDLSWTRREIVDEGGEAVLLEASALEGLTSAEIAQLFRDARAKDYGELARALDALSQGTQRGRPQDRQTALAELSRIEEQLGILGSIDFFPSGAGDQLKERLAEVRRSREQRNAPNARAKTAATLSTADYQGRTWVTRRGVKVDRVACAWLIRRFIDPKAKFKFVDWAAYDKRPLELCFDTPEGEFTHEGDACSFEVLCGRFALTSTDLKRIAEIVHDLDIKDGRYLHPETDGVRALIEGIIAQHEGDEARIEVASTLFDALRRASPPPTTKRKAGAPHARHKARST